ncbi:hypothetical protein NEJ09_004241 [Salmonella enterica]|nr:hypothetical protein [Salmonella enterica]HCM1854067.1 hypothetical protein [Salmonella enterica subsp. arizonae serovar 56:z4,z23:-]EBB1398665.1 hypothetical protein [Salmonella enterica]EDI9916624.1 hypothetical protein [Salmonella enterica]EGA9875481.1 hypothetical protein [Salmonella enterica]
MKLKHALLILSCISSFANARTEQDFAAAKAQCLSMSGSYTAQQFENNRVPGFNHGLVDGMNTFAVVNANQQRQEIYRDCLRGQKWGEDGSDFRGDVQQSDAPAKSSSPVMTEINNIPELSSWLKFDQKRFNVSVDSDNYLRSKSGWKGVPLHDRFMRVVDITNAIFGDNPNDDEKCLVKDIKNDTSHARFDLAAIRMYPADMVKNYAFMCDKKTNPESLNRFESEVVKKTNVIAAFPSVKVVGDQSPISSKSVDDY